MRRCGAQLHATLPSWKEEDRGSSSDLYRQQSKKKIMGWPATVGVWIYRSPSTLFDFKDMSMEEELEYLGKV